MRRVPQGPLHALGGISTQPALPLTLVPSKPCAPALSAAYPSSKKRAGGGVLRGIAPTVLTRLWWEKGVTTVSPNVRLPDTTWQLASHLYFWLLKFFSFNFCWNLIFNIPLMWNHEVWAGGGKFSFSNIQHPLILPPWPPNLIAFDRMVDGPQMSQGYDLWSLGITNSSRIQVANISRWIPAGWPNVAGYAHIFSSGILRWYHLQFLNENTEVQSLGSRLTS